MSIRELIVHVDGKRVSQDSFDDLLLAYKLRVSVARMVPLLLGTVDPDSIMRADCTKLIGHRLPALAYYTP